MPKPSPPTSQRSLFTEHGFVEETTDDVARKTFKGKDEVQFEKEQKRRSAKKQTVYPIPETGSCCARCRHYDGAEDRDGFGECRILGVTRTALPPHIEKGVIVDVVQVFARFVVETDPLRCKPWAGQGCSAFSDVAHREDAA